MNREEKENCKICSGSGFIMKPFLTQKCCERPDEDGSCCGLPDVDFCFNQLACPAACCTEQPKQ